MPSFWYSRPKAPVVNTQNLPPQQSSTSALDQSPSRTFPLATIQPRSSDEGDNTLSGQLTPKPSGLDNRIPAISSVYI